VLLDGSGRIDEGRYNVSANQEVKTPSQWRFQREKFGIVL